MIGFKIISEMTREELIAEILDHNRVALEARDIPTLKGMVINNRLEAAKDALIKEAKITTISGPFGTAYITDEE